ncbi:MAG TPA: DUF3105 domain-containing protein [Solirubrobacteraceae bacterium]|nr:DUF3105 domain-containing protein [Solirubrobacteraceae bacterium]
MRRLGGLVLALAVAAAGAVGLLLVLAPRDRPPVANQGGPGQAYADLGARHLRPGERRAVAFNSDPPTSGPHLPLPIRRDAQPISDDQLLQALERGDVVIFYPTTHVPAPLRSIQRGISGRTSSALAAAGQSVILAPRRGLHGIVAVAWRHLLRTGNANDPRLRGFAEFWLGRGHH